MKNSAVIALILLFITGCRTNITNKSTLERKCKDYLVRLDVDPMEAPSIGSYNLKIYEDDEVPCFVDGLIWPRDGSIEGFWVLPGNGQSFTILIWTCCAGSGGYSNLDVFIFKNSKLTIQMLPDLTEAQLTGYMGHDIFGIVTGRIFRSFPKYNQGDSNAEPTGGRAWFIYQPMTKKWQEIKK